MAQVLGFVGCPVALGESCRGMLATEGGWIAEHAIHSNLRCALLLDDALGRACA